MKRIGLAVLLSLLLLMTVGVGVAAAAEANLAFVPNSGEASVSKVNLETQEEIARYYTAPRLGQDGNTVDPYAWRTSRIAMDADNNAWVVNTGANGINLQGSIVRIQADTADLANTHAYPDPVLDFGTDDAVKVFPVGNPGDIPRAIAIDDQGFIWVGFYGSGALIKYEYSDSPGALSLAGGPYYPAEGTIRYYEMKFDSSFPQQMLYISSRASDPRLLPVTTGVWRFDGTEFVLDLPMVYPTSPYSLLIAKPGDFPGAEAYEGTVYATDYTNLLWIRDPDTGNWVSRVISGANENRGMGFDEAGRVWIASTLWTSSGNKIFSYDPATGFQGPTYSLPVGTTPVGVGRDNSGIMWAICRSDSQEEGWLEGFDPSVDPPAYVGSIQVGYRPYAYSDFLGTVLQELAALGDFVWYDTNGNGIQDDGEPGIPGVTVILYDCEGNELATTTTDDTGYYLFDGLVTGCYEVKFVLPQGYVFTLQNQDADDAKDSDADPITGLTGPINLTVPDRDLTWDAGMYRLACFDETAWAFGGDYATANNTVEGNPSDAWGWTNYISKGEYTFPLYAGAGQNDISKGTLVGEVRIVYAAGCVTVTYEVYDASYAYVLAETHLWVGTTPLPLNDGTPTAAPGQFLDLAPVVNPDHTVTYQVCDLEGDIRVAAHAVVAWCDGTILPPPGSEMTITETDLPGAPGLGKKEEAIEAYKGKGKKD